MTKTPKKSKNNPYWGTSFVFHDQGHKIVLWRSVWNNDEKVWVDGQLVSDKVAMRADRWHEFQWGLNTYRLETRQEGFWTVHNECTLLRNDVLTHRKTHMAKVNPTTERILAFLGLFFTIIMLTGGVMGNMDFIGVKHVSTLLFISGLHWSWHKAFVDFWWVQDNFERGTVHSFS